MVNPNHFSLFVIDRKISRNYLYDSKLWSDLEASKVNFTELVMARYGSHITGCVQWLQWALQTTLNHNTYLITRPAQQNSVDCGVLVMMIGDSLESLRDTM